MNSLLVYLLVLSWFSHHTGGSCDTWRCQRKKAYLKRREVLTSLGERLLDCLTSLHLDASRPVKVDETGLSEREVLLRAIPRHLISTLWKDLKKCTLLQKRKKLWRQARLWATDDSSSSYGSRIEEDDQDFKVLDARSLFRILRRKNRWRLDRFPPRGSKFDRVSSVRYNDNKDSNSNNAEETESPKKRNFDSSHLLSLLKRCVSDNRSVLRNLKTKMADVGESIIDEKDDDYEEEEEDEKEEEDGDNNAGDGVDSSYVENDENIARHVEQKQSSPHHDPNMMEIIMMTTMMDERDSV